MRWFEIVEYDEKGDTVQRLSEDDIIDQYWDYWYGKMCEKFGKEVVDAKYTKQHCIDDWIVVNWAMEVKND